jgi:hypothetical protein
MRSFIYIKIVLFLICAQACKVPEYNSTAKPITHDQWDALLQKHVDEAGWVNYNGFIKDSIALDKYLDLLSAHHPNKSWSRNQRMAYWINAYNAFTVDLIAKHYPVESIKDIKKGIPFVNTVWDIKFIEIEDRTYDLNNIEHGILRPKFSDPRIHFAVNCASVSCPKLSNRAYEAERLNEQLDSAAVSFLHDTSRNNLHTRPIKLSKIFSWFSGDFKKEEKNIIKYVNRYVADKIPENAEVDHLDYDWRLNESPNGLIHH